jgi:hypothetical protein
MVASPVEYREITCLLLLILAVKGCDYRWDIEYLSQANSSFGGPVSRKPAPASALLYTALDEDAP